MRKSAFFCAWASARACLLCGVALGLAVVTAGAEEVRIYRPLGDSEAPQAEAAEPVAKAAVPAKIYTVEKGDTLWKISRKCHVSVEALRKANHLATDHIVVGTSLMLPAEGKSLSAAVPAEEVRRAEVVASAPTPAPAAAPAAPAAGPTVVPAAAVLNAGGEGVGPTQAELQRRFLTETKSLALSGVGYDQDWTPPGKDEAWDMDCSNTSRYLYQKVLGVSMQRTASDQYYDLHQDGRAWDVPLDASGQPDVAWLETHLRVGDLLFWENTYKPRRDPPITHVMIYLGKNNRGQELMAGSQTAGGFFNTSGSGPDVYLFKPTASVGGYYKNLGFTHVTGRFVAIGRPAAIAPRAPLQIAAR